MTLFKKNKESDQSGEVEKHWPQILAILIGSLTGFTEGVNYSWTSPFIVKITEDKTNYDISEEQASLFNTVTPIAFLVGCPIFSMLSDKIGRKKTFYWTAILQILGWLFSAFANNIYLFHANRICAGLANSCFFAVFQIYVGEIANPSVRGRWGNMSVTSMYLGELMINVIGSYFGVRDTSFIFLPLPFIFLILFSFMPESPYFYIMKGKEEEAKKTLIFFTQKKNIEKDFLQLKMDVNRQLSESGSWSDLFKIKSNRRAVLAGTFLRLTQQTSACGIFMTFTQTIFEKSGGNFSRELSSIILLGANLVLNILVFVFIVHRFSRRKLYIVSLAGSGLVLYLMGTYFYVDANLNVDLSSFKWVPMAGMLSWLFFASFGICIIPTLMMSELFSASIKAKAIMFLLIFFSVGNLVINTTFFYLVEYLGFYSPFYVYAICNTVATVLSFYVIPETKDKTLEEIQQMLKKKNMNSKDHNS